MRGAAMNPDYDRLLRIFMIGDEGVGKSCLVLRWADDTYTESYISTIGVDYKIRTNEIEKQVVKQQVWDNLGRNNLEALHRISNDRSHPKGIVFVFDLTNKASFDRMRQRIEEARAIIGSNSNVQMILVGNKSDLIYKREVDEKEAQKLAAEFNIPYIEASAKDSTNVDQVIEQLSTNILKKDAIEKRNKNLDVDHYNRMQLKLIKGFEKYISDIEKSKTSKGKINFRQFKFPFFKDSRAINREANYYLAQELLNELKKPTSDIRKLFTEENIIQIRNEVIKDRRLYLRDEYVNRGLKSSALKNVINMAQTYIKDIAFTHTQSETAPLLGKRTKKY